MKKIKISLIFLLISLICTTEIRGCLAKETKVEIINKQVYEKIVDDLGLSPKDIKIYKQMFAASNENRWDKTEKRKEKLQSNALLGHIYAKKYLSKNYTSSYPELIEWLEKYNDHPQYKTIYRLAARKGNPEELREALSYLQTIPLIEHYGYNLNSEDISHLSDDNKKYVINKVALFRKSISSGKSKAAKTILEDKKFKKLAPSDIWNTMATTLSTLYFTDNYDKLALEWAEKAKKDPIATWFGGLAAWRLGNYKKAAQMFDKLAKMDINDDWMLSAGGYWSYRSHSKLKDNKTAKQALTEAAKHKRTFYGILANSKLGNNFNYNWEYSSFATDFSTDEYVDLIMSSAALKRAIFLASIGEKKLAGEEIKSAYISLDNSQREIAMFIAEQYEMFDVSIQISNSLKDTEKDIHYDYISYHLPDWNKRIWTVDQALTLALIRQESLFNSTAISRVGAAGLMQLMPNTAVYISKNKKIKKDNSILFQTEYNLELGQKYISYLAQKPYIDGNLFFLMTAYNAGPGNLLKWKKNTKYKDDPLMFIEAIPSRETRIYIERVMANYWIYSFRLNKKLPSLEQVGKNQWPTL